jgi:hypothetical protein
MLCEFAYDLPSLEEWTAEQENRDVREVPLGEPLPTLPDSSQPE